MPTGKVSIIPSQDPDTFLFVFAQPIGESDNSKVASVCSLSLSSQRTELVCHPREIQNSPANSLMILSKVDMSYKQI